jgi:hypothetical protein
MKMILVAAVLFLFISTELLATSIRMNGLMCAQDHQLSDVSTTNIKVQSNFSVTQTLTDSTYKIRLSGGFPRFDNSGNVCIDTFLGHNAEFPSPDFEGLSSFPDLSNYVDGVGYFNGAELIIMIDYIRSTKTGFSNSSDYPYSFLTSAFGNLSYTLIFDYKPAFGEFVLRKSIFRSSISGAGGYTALPGLYMESIEPNKEIMVIKSSGDNIIYKISQ